MTETVRMLKIRVYERIYYSNDAGDSASSFCQPVAACRACDVAAQVAALRIDYLTRVGKRFDVEIRFGHARIFSYPDFARKRYPSEILDAYADYIGSVALADMMQELERRDDVAARRERRKARVESA